MTIYEMEKSFKEIWESGPSVEIKVVYAYDGMVECIISPHSGTYFRCQGDDLLTAVKGAIRRFKRWQDDEAAKPDEDFETLESCFRGED